MTLLSVIAIYLILIGSGIAAVVAYRHQNTMMAWIALKDSGDPGDREIADFVESRHKRYFFGITLRQRRLFWVGVAMIIAGTLLQAYEVTQLYLEPGGGSG